MVSLKTNVRSMGGIYKRYAASLEKLGITKLEDFLYHIPFRYEDYSLISSISQAQPGETVTVRGEVLEIKNQYTRSHFTQHKIGAGFTLQKAKVKDPTGQIDIVWFNQPYIPKSISIGDKISLSGKVEEKTGKLQLSSPDFEIGERDFIHTGRLVPVYPETRGVSSKWIRRQVFKLLNENKNEIEDYFPDEILKRNQLNTLFYSFKQIHFPESLNEITSARSRLAFDELFLIQISSTLRRLEWQKNLTGNPFDINSNKKKVDELIKKLPFELTNAQKRTTDEIFSDLSADKPMNRLLEGDVGSGKTIVAAIAMYLTHLNGSQSALMAPTEILAQQHYKTITDLLSPLGVKVQLFTSSSSTKKIKDHKSFNIAVGTHALIYNKVKLDSLGLVVIDEQQRFGVEQRAIIRKKGKNPHVLTMTATPIPRTIALTMYGDLDLSLLDEMPKGRKIIKTWLVPTVKRANAYEWIKKQINQTNIQVFIICPFIEESETMQTVKAATKEFDSLQKNVFKKYKLGLIHGKLKSKEKEETLNDFKNKKLDILVATPVVEVGIDIPNAGVILIEASERFGLSQLHQLRGRVGRNSKQAYCLLFTESNSPLTNQRLKAMETTNIGAELAEFDLKMRGPGEIYGTAQHGKQLLKIARFSDFDLIKQTRAEAERIITKLDRYPKLSKKIKEINSREISPD